MRSPTLSSQIQLTRPSLPPHLPPRCYRPPLLHPTNRPHLRLLGPHNPQPNSPRSNVLVLFPSRAGRTHLVEKMDHSSTNHSIRYRSRIRLFRLLHLLLFHLLPEPPYVWEVCWGGICGVRGHGNTELLFVALH